MIQRNIKVPIFPTPEELAQEFCASCETQQAQFFNEVARITNKWESLFCFQLQAIVDSDILTDDARLIMSDIGDYAYSK